MALSTGELYNQDNAWRFPHSIIAMTHEIGHMLGAHHDDTLPVSIMNSNVLPYVDTTPLQFSYKSKTEIQSCLSKP